MFKDKMSQYAKSIYYYVLFSEVYSILISDLLMLIKKCILHEIKKKLVGLLTQYHLKRVPIL